MLGQVVFLKTGDVYDFIRFSGSHCLIWKCPRYGFPRWSGGSLVMEKRPQDEERPLVYGVGDCETVVKFVY